MSTELLEKARSGLEAWQKGDVDALEPLLDAGQPVTWSGQARSLVLNSARDVSGAQTSESLWGSQAKPALIVVAGPTLVQAGADCANVAALMKLRSRRIPRLMLS
jgi:hypothetical protein